MPGISVTDQIDALLTTTLRNYRNILVDNIFEKMVLLKWLREGKRLRKIDGGHQIAEQLMYGKNNTVKAYSQYETLTTTPQEGLTQAIYDWKEYGGTISISRREMRQNSGEARLLDLLKAKIRQAELSLRDKISTDLFADITAEPAKALTGILLHAADSPSTTTVGSISGATYAFWRNVENDCGEYTANLLPTMRSTYNEVSKAGVGRVSGICCTQLAFEDYEALASPENNDLQRFTLVRKEKRALDLGFEVFSFKGADMFWDPDFATNTPVTGESMIMFVDEAISLVIDKESDFITTDFIEPENQTAKVAKVLTMLNLTNNNRRALGLVHGIDQT